MAAAAGTAALMVLVGAAAPAENKTVVQDRGIRMERYVAEQAAAVREEEELSRVHPKMETICLNGYEQEMLMKLTMAEAGGEDLEGKALVMRVVINRLRDPEFPNTVQGVICEPGQFSPMSDGRYYDMVPDEECDKALYMIMHGWDESQGATYFRTVVHDTTWHSENLKELFTHGNHTFYKEL